ncbi:FGGY family carbohydrate kinase [Amylolactobacillus amylophilus]|uniref:FGGY family carbohydrate kinase n=1 Tax=Amylolactobacillus amylophilus TaxID=1603 RepID=UPI000A93C0C4|nr:FGGY family carbohydrate kinase [Amylolactobacillus amylophilus]
MQSSTTQVTYQNTSALTTYSGAHGARYQSATEILQQLTELLLGIPVEERTKIQTIALSTAMHSTWPVDPASEQNDQIFIWSDRQAAGVMADFRQSELSKIFYQKTGTPIYPMTPFAKIKYFKRQMPTRYSSETKWLGLKELLLEFLTGKDVLDYPTANATGLFNIHELRWDADILADLDIGTQNLAELVDWQTPLKLKQSVVSAFGLAKSVAVYPGASDGVLAAAAGLSQSGNGNSLTIGTSALCAA